MSIAQAVHTVGINWASDIAVVCSVVLAMGVLLGFMARMTAKYVANAITRSIDRFRIEVIEKMNTRVTVLEALNGIKQHKDD